MNFETETHRWFYKPYADKNVTPGVSLNCYTTLMVAKLLILMTLFTSLLVGGVSVAEARSSYGSIRMPTYRTPSYRIPSIRDYPNGGNLRYQNGYFRSNGTYVQPHFKTSPDDTVYNNRKYILGY